MPYMVYQFYTKFLYVLIIKSRAISSYNALLFNNLFILLKFALLMVRKLTGY